MAVCELNIVVTAPNGEDPIAIADKNVRVRHHQEIVNKTKYPTVRSTAHAPFLIAAEAIFFSIIEQWRVLVVAMSLHI
jgi:hypothetical protein